MDLYTDSTNKNPPVTEVLEEKIDTENFGMPIRYYYVNTSDED